MLGTGLRLESGNFFPGGFFPTTEKMHSEKTVKRKTVSTENRSSHQRCSMKKDVLKNFTEFTGGPATLLKRDSGTGFFLRILRTF